MMCERCHISGELVINNYAEQKTRDSVSRVERERTGRGCGCLNCAKSSVEEANEWIDWHAAGNEKIEEYKDALKYRIKSDKRWNAKGKVGNWRIVIGEDE
jgi:hypothetical protein